MPLPPAPRRLRSAVRAGGAVGAQGSQALASLVLQVLVSRTLGAAGLADYALLYGGAVLATAVVTGLVGDTLTVVDRSQPRPRAGLQWWTVVAATALGALVGVVGGAATGLGAVGALALGLAVAAFLVEDTLRRLLMACSRFWSVVVVDVSALAGALAVVAVLGAVTSGPVLSTYLWALLGGQVVACAAAVALLPREERWLAPWSAPHRGVVAGFGAWRAAQQTLRPGALTAARVLVVAALGAGTYGQVEAARLLVTPIALVVSGMGNVLLVRYARSRGREGLAPALRRADAAAVGLLGAAVVLGAAATAAAPLAEDLVTGGAYALERVAVAGWVLYGATSGLVLPYATLAAVRGRQGTVFGLRVVDSALSVGLVAALLGAGAAAASMPYALASGSLLSALLVRRLVLVPLVAAERSAPPAPRGEPAAGPTAPERSPTRPQ